MGRKKSTEPKKPNPPKNSPPVLTEDQEKQLAFSHKRLYEAALQKKSEADAVFKNACKKARADLGDHGVELIKDLIALDGDEAEFKAEMERKGKAARWMGALHDTQIDWVDEAMEPAVDRAYREGSLAALNGAACRPPYDASVPQYEAWIKGHTDETVKINIQRAEGIKPLDEEKSVPEAGSTPPPTTEGASLGTAPSTLKVVR
jgi:hypothetical protein